MEENKNKKLTETNTEPQHLSQNKTGMTASSPKLVIPTYRQFTNLKKPTKLNLTTSKNSNNCNNIDECKQQKANEKQHQNVVTSSSTSLNSKEDSAYSSLANSTITSQEIRSSPKQKQLTPETSIDLTSMNHQTTAIATNKCDLIMNNNNSNNYFKPILTPSKTQTLKSFEIIELNENHNNNSRIHNDTVIKLRKSPPRHEDVAPSVNLEDELMLVDDNSEPTTTASQKPTLSHCLANEFKRNSLVNNKNYNDLNTCDYVTLDKQTYKMLMEDFHATKIMLYKLSSMLSKDNFDSNDVLMTSVSVSSSTLVV